VPNVLGLRLAKAKQRIRHNNCSVGDVRRVRSRRQLRGRVVDQHPNGGRVRDGGFPVDLKVGRGRGH
jgi:beta-lactam-binding protein with PASTA domain